MSEPSILRTGRNCWRVAHADRATLLVDGAAYFHAFREAAKNARLSVQIIGWDVDGRFELEREPPDDGLPTRLGDFLIALLRRRKRLEVQILDWDFAMIYAIDRQWLPWYRLDWSGHRRLHFRFDSRHPVGASQHQKIVVIDDRVAFVGGLDFALGRWDTPEHRPGDPRRRDNNGTIQQPYHDVQLMVSGPVAAALGELARTRWYTATGRKLKPAELPAEHNPWPQSIDTDLADVAVGIARTCPEYNGQEEVQEVEQLLLDAIGAAREVIYIENQYFTAHSIGAALAERLVEDNGPEIVVLLPQHTVGWLSQNTMEVLRERLIKRLGAADRHDRLRVYHPHVPGLDKQCVNLHAKVMIIDDQLLCVGSANFNNRSMGLDSECDLAVEAGDDARTCSAIAALRNRLLSEHLDVTPTALAETLERQHSVIRSIEALSSSGRTLRPFEFRVSPQLDALVPDAQIADPEMPVDADRLAEEFIADEDRPATRRALVTLASILVIALLLAASWRWLPLGNWLDIELALGQLASLRGSWLAPGIVLAVYILGGLVVFPVTLLIIATGMAFGAFYGFVYALLGAELSAIVMYGIGQRLGHDTLHSLSHRWVGRISRRLARQGLLAIITLRVVPVAPFSVINLVAGASHIRFRDFATGTLIGMTPGTLALTVFSDQVVAAIQAPGVIRLAGLLVLATAIAAGTWALGHWLLKRHKHQSTGASPDDR